MINMVKSTSNGGGDAQSPPDGAGNNSNDDEQRPRRHDNDDNTGSTRSSNRTADEIANGGSNASNQTSLVDRQEGQQQDSGGGPSGGGGGGGGGGSKSNGRFSHNNNNSKRLISSPASAADTRSTCSLSTTASHGMGGMGSSIGGGTGTAMLGAGGGSMAVGTLTAAGAGGGQAAGMNVNSRHSAKNQLSRHERRALRRQRRGGSNQQRRRRNQTPAAVLRQLQTMSATLGASFGLFLLFYLNLPALLFLITTIAVGALTAMIGYQYLLLQYNAILASGGFLQYLPEGVQTSLRDALAGTTLHEWMTDPAFFMEYRYLMLYFIPGLDAEQLDALVDRLPERHRSVLRQPGYMSSMTPATVRRVLLADDGVDRNNDGTVPALPASSSGDNGNNELNDGTRRQLFGEDEENEVDENTPNDQDRYEPSTTELWADIAATVTSVLQGSAVGQQALGVIQEEGGNDNDDSSVDGGLVIERLPSAEWDNDNDDNDDESVERRQERDAIPPTVTTMARQVSPERGVSRASIDDSSLASEGQPSQPQVVGLPQTPPPSQSPEEEQQIEGDLLNDAVATMSRNYVNAAAEAATSTARDMVVGAVEFLTPGIVRLGLGTSVFSGFGLFGSYYMNYVRDHPLGWRRPLPALVGDGSSGGSSSSGGGGEREVMTTTARYVTYGLLSSAFLGGTSAGFMLLLRNGVRRSIAAERAKSEEKSKKAN